jgi:tetratricopeptide (TPR) repeat protein
MDRQFFAIRDGKYDEAIKIAKDDLRKNPNDTDSHFTLALAYESTGDSRQALEHAAKCLDLLPDSFEVLALAARCAAAIDRHHDAFKYAEQALKDGRDPNLPKAINLILRCMSYIPGLRTLRDTNASVVSAYANQTQWLRDYVAWYEEQSPSIKIEPQPPD